MSEVKNILIIDDELISSLITKKKLHKENELLNIIEINNARTAVEKLSNELIKIDLLLLDLNMPDMNGWEFIEKYKELDDAHKSKKVFVLTTSINPSDEKKSKEYGCIDGFLHKPINVTQLQNTFEIEI